MHHRSLSQNLQENKDCPKEETQRKGQKNQREKASYFLFLFLRSRVLNSLARPRTLCSDSYEPSIIH